jgi:transcriptional regulator with XRE-family HTH domain
VANLLIREIVKREVEVPNLGEKIKQVQIDSKLSVEKVIRGLDISRTYWNKMVAERDMAVSIDLIRRIECFFGVSFDVTFPDDRPVLVEKPTVYKTKAD